MQVDHEKILFGCGSGLYHEKSCSKDAVLTFEGGLYCMNKNKSKK
jgi:hypothetical protein